MGRIESPRNSVTQNNDVIISTPSDIKDKFLIETRLLWNLFVSLLKTVASGSVTALSSYLSRQLFPSMVYEAVMALNRTVAASVRTGVGVSVKVHVSSAASCAAIGTVGSS